MRPKRGKVGFNPWAGIVRLEAKGLSDHNGIEGEWERAAKELQVTLPLDKRYLPKLEKNSGNFFP